MEDEMGISIEDGMGNTLTEGVEAQRADIVAQRAADERGLSVWMWEGDEVSRFDPAVPAEGSITVTDEHGIPDAVVMPRH